MSNSELLEIYLEKNVLQQEKRLFPCSLCPYRTDRRNNLKRHTATMHEQSTAVLECCGNRFANKASLRHHTAAFHSHGYVCTICGRVFCRRALLRRHHAVHSGFKEFTCQFCDYATSHKSNLERHMKIHDSSTSSPMPSSSSLGDGQSCAGSSNGSGSQSPQEFSTISGDSHPGTSRDHNPILASLLSQPANADDQVIQWVYHSPYDSYSGYAGDPSGDHGPLQQQLTQPSPLPSSHYPYLAQGGMMNWGFDSETHSFMNRFSWEEVRQTGKSIAKEASSNLPLRHAIDVILGLKEESPKPNNFMWSSKRSNELQSGGGLLSYGDIAADSDRCSIGSKRPWDEGDHGSLSGSRPSSSSDQVGSPQLQYDTSCREDDEEKQYVPKKLRMSKRYQNFCVSLVPKKLRMSKRYQNLCVSLVKKE